VRITVFSSTAVSSGKSSLLKLRSSPQPDCMAKGMRSLKGGAYPLSTQMERCANGLVINLRVRISFT